MIVRKRLKRGGRRNVWGVIMFDILDDRMKQDDHAGVTPAARVIRWLLVALFSIVLFGSLYIGIRMLE
jgi:hypothetical protein